MEISPIFSAQILCLSFLTILFLQSGLDKVFNYKGNHEWLSGHFSKSFLKKMVGIMLPTITLLEVTSGILCGVGLVYFIVDGISKIALLGAQFSALSIVALFLGQRIEQDYEGAATLTTYFIIAIMTIVLMGL